MSETQRLGCVQGCVATEGQRWEQGLAAHLTSFSASNGFVLYVPPCSSHSRGSAGKSDAANSGGGTGMQTTAQAGGNREPKAVSHVRSTGVFSVLKDAGMF